MRQAKRLPANLVGTDEYDFFRLGVDDDHASALDPATISRLMAQFTVTGRARKMDTGDGFSRPRRTIVLRLRTATLRGHEHLYRLPANLASVREMTGRGSIDARSRSERYDFGRSPNQKRLGAEVAS